MRLNIRGFVPLACLNEWRPRLRIALIGADLQEPRILPSNHLRERCPCRFHAIVKPRTPSPNKRIPRRRRRRDLGSVRLEFDLDGGPLPLHGADAGLRDLAVLLDVDMTPLPDRPHRAASRLVAKDKQSSAGQVNIVDIDHGQSVRGEPISSDVTLLPASMLRPPPAPDALIERPALDNR